MDGKVVILTESVLTMKQGLFQTDIPTCEIRGLFGRIFYLVVPVLHDLVEIKAQALHDGKPPLWFGIRERFELFYIMTDGDDGMLFNDIFRPTNTDIRFLVFIFLVHTDNIAQGIVGCDSVAGNIVCPHLSNARFYSFGVRQNDIAALPALSIEKGFIPEVYKYPSVGIDHGCTRYMRATTNATYY